MILTFPVTMDYLGLQEIPHGPVSAAAPPSHQAPSFFMDKIELMSQGHPKATIGLETSSNELHCDGRSTSIHSTFPGSSDRVCEYDSASPSTSPSFSPSRSPSPRPQKTILDKPLEQLTEEDILHLTREDCRRYLKEKGMRRPSWNKSQAIQQVLSLKGLFDSKEDTQKSLRPSLWLKKLSNELPASKEVQVVCTAPLTQQILSAMTHHSSSAIHIGRELSQEFCTISDQRYGKPDLSAINQLELVCTAMPSFNKHPRSMPDYTWPPKNEPALCHKESQSMYGMEPSSQLTIFYSGIVNVYDDIPADKAKAIMLLAARSNDTLNPSCLRSFNDDPVTTLAREQVQYDLDQQSSRKASLQRYLEKRRGRYHSKAPYLASSKGAEGEHPPQLVPKLNATVFEMVLPCYLRQGQLPSPLSGSETSSHKMTIR